MKLYEAIELGSGLVRENHAYYLTNEKDPCGCALGTAWMALFPFREWAIWNGKEITRRIATRIATSGIVVPCPLCSYSTHVEFSPGVELEWLVNHLHAHHRWSRQQIADWLKPIEDEYERQHPVTDVKTQDLERIES